MSAPAAKGEERGACAGEAGLPAVQGEAREAPAGVAGAGRPRAGALAAVHLQKINRRHTRMRYRLRSCACGNHGIIRANRHRVHSLCSFLACIPVTG